MGPPAEGAAAQEADEVQLQLTGFLPRIESGGAGAALVAGPGGNLRSSVVASVQNEAARRGWTVLTATATPELREVPRGLVLKALRSLVPASGSARTGGPSGSRSGAVGLPMALVPLISEEKGSGSRPPRPAEAPGPVAPGGSEWAPPPTVTGADVEAFLLERLRTSSELHPVLLTLEDVEWADDLSFWLVRRLLHQRGFPRTLLMLTMDREEESRVPAGLLVPPPSPFVWQRWDLKGREPGAVGTTRPGESAAGEDERDQEILAEAAVLGVEFQEDLLAKVTGLAPKEISAVLLRSEQRGYLLATEDGFRFPTRAIWTWALGEPPALVRRRHLKAAKVLEQLYPDPRGKVVFDLARHYEEAGVHRKAFDYLLRSAEVSLQTGATREAVERLQRALTRVSHLPAGDQAGAEVSVYRRLADSERLLGNQEQATSALRRALRASTMAKTPPGDVARMEITLARLLNDLTTVKEVEALLDSAEQHARTAGVTGTQAQVACRRAIVRGLKGQNAEAVAELDRADALLPADALPEEAALVHGTCFDLWFMGVLGDLPRARKGVRRSREEWERSGSAFEVLRTLDHEALVADAEGDWEGALRSYRRLAQESQKAGYILLTITGRGNEAETLAEMGRLDEARVALEDARKQLTLIEDVQDDSQLDLVSALIAWKEGQSARAIESIDRSLARYQASGIAELADQMLFLKARILHSVGRTGEARAIVEGLTNVNPILRSPLFQQEWAKLLGKNP